MTVTARPDPIVVRRQNELFDLYQQFAGDGDPDDDPEFVDAAREIMGLPPLDDDDLDPETRDRVLALAEMRFADEMRAMDDNQLKRYWTVGEGLKRWRFHPHPWTKLRNLLRKHVGPGRAERMASEWFHTVFGYWSGSRKGDNPVGPG